MAEILDEIGDELRREQLHQFWKENGPWILGGVAGAILLTAFISFKRHWDFSRNVKATAELSQLVDMGNPEKLEAFAKDGDKQHAMMARFVAAGDYISKGQKDKALAIYKDIAGTSGLDRLWRDLAGLRSISLRLDNAAPEILESELKPLAADDAPWRYSARELQALLAARQGDDKRAAQILSALSDDPQTPDNVRQRASSLSQLYAAGTGKR